MEVSHIQIDHRYVRSIINRTKKDNKITKLMHVCLLNCMACDSEGDDDGAEEGAETSVVFSFEQVYLQRLGRTTLYTPLLAST